MAYDFKTTRLFRAADLSAGLLIELDRNAGNYLANVMRLGSGDPVLVFNGRDGEWRAELDLSNRKKPVLHILEQTREQTPAPRIDYLFAPLKHARLDYMVQKATEMGAARLQPVITQHTQSARVNLDRMRANVIEAAEQCGILSIPEVLEPRKLPALISGWNHETRLIFCDEREDGEHPLDTLGKLGGNDFAVLIGPEGGFSANERELLRSKPFVTPIGLGPRILRADTAAVAALSLIQAKIGDW